MARTAQCLQFSCGGAVISWITLVGRERLSMSPDGSGKAPLRVIARSRVMVSTAARLSASSRCTQLTTSRSNSRRPTCQMLGGTSPAPSFAGTCNCNLHQHHRGFSLPGTVLGVVSGVWGLMRAQHDWPEQSGPGPASATVTRDGLGPARAGTICNGARAASTALTGPHTAHADLRQAGDRERAPAGGFFSA